MTEIEIVRTLRAAPRRVWRAFTEGDELASWFWPARFESAAHLDPVVGGTWRIASEVTGMGVSGVYAAVDEPERLVFTWRWDDEPEETLVTVTLDPTGDGGTRLTVLHERFLDAGQARSHTQGWSDCLDRLHDLQTTV